ncbi:MAG TPA: hypothetical protein PLK63_03805 [Catalimonadaceae bacterium]|nr:hypothetical protein [Catalimonadaceae bacterium]
MNKILLAHLKKPPYETRIFDKIGKALAFSGDLQISILGNTIASLSEIQIPENIRLYSLFQSRAHFSQISTDLLRFQTFLHSELPDVVVVCSPELLAQAVIYSLIYKKTLVWDMQENYPFNYSYQETYRWPTNKVLKLLSGTYLSALLPFVHKVWYAEQIYKDQIQTSRFSVIENKIAHFQLEANPRLGHKTSNYFLFSGYLTEESGVLKALDFFTSYQVTVPEMELFIVGYCPSERLQSILKSRADLNRSIHLVGLDHWVLSDRIFEILQSARAVLMPYKETKANESKIPTKLFEAASFQIPIILPFNSQFQSVAAKLNVAVLEANFSHPDTNDFIKLESEIASIRDIPRVTADSFLSFDAEQVNSDIREFILPA